MGRLIDADKLRTQFPEPADWLDINQTLVHKTGIWANIDAADTVEAIPVEWIEAKMQWLREHNGAFYDPAYFLETMLKEWKEEQEAPHCGPDYCDINFGGGTKA